VIIAIQTDSRHAIVDSPYLNVINELCETPPHLQGRFFVTNTVLESIMCFVVASTISGVVGIILF